MKLYEYFIDDYNSIVDRYFTEDKINTAFSEMLEFNKQEGINEKKFSSFKQDVLDQLSKIG